MNGIIMSLLGGFVASLLLEMIIPNGDLKKYSRFVISIVVAMIILSPIIGAIGGLSGKEFTFDGFNLDENYIESRDNEKISVIEGGVEEYLEINGIDCDVEVFYENEIIQRVTVKGVANNKSKRAKELVSELLEINKERVNVYE